MRITIASHYYGNEVAVKRALDRYVAMHNKHPDSFEFVLVDDHSNPEINLSIFAEAAIRRGMLRVFRVNQDIVWNMAAARNIAALESCCPLILLMDIDHIVALKDTETLIEKALAMPRKSRALFKRVMVDTKGTRTEKIPHLNSFLMHRADFFTIGGYDEMFSGSYGDEDKYFQWCVRRRGWQEPVLDVELEVAEGFATRALDRDRTRNNGVLNHLTSLGIPSSHTRFQCDHVQIFG